MYSTLEKVKNVEYYNKATNSVVATQQINVCCSPSFTTIKSIVAKFKNKDSVLIQQ